MAATATRRSAAVPTTKIGARVEGRSSSRSSPSRSRPFPAATMSAVHAGIRSPELRIHSAVGSSSPDASSRSEPATDASSGMTTSGFGGKPTTSPRLTEAGLAGRVNMGPGTRSLHDLYHIVAGGLVHRVAGGSGQVVPRLLESGGQGVCAEASIPFDGLAAEPLGGFVVAGGPGGEGGDGRALGGEERALLLLGGEPGGLR